MNIIEHLYCTITVLFVVALDWWHGDVCWWY